MIVLSSLFNIARAFDHHDIRVAFEKIDPDRIATVMDLDNCFFHQGLHQRGLIGSTHLLSREKFIDVAGDRVGDDIPLFHLPGSLLKDGSRDVWKDKILLRTACAQKPGQIIDIDALTHDIDNPPGHFECLYVGDYINLLDQAYSFTTLLRAAPFLGNRKHALDILHAFQALPDYSEHFPERPPRNGKPHQTQDDAKSWNPVPALR